MSATSQLTPDLSADELSAVRRILPSYDTLPDLLTDPETAALLRWKPHTLSANRSTHRHSLGYIRSGRKPLTPKVEVARFVLRNAVGIALA